MEEGHWNFSLHHSWFAFAYYQWALLNCCCSPLPHSMTMVEKYTYWLSLSWSFCFEYGLEKFFREFWVSPRSNHCYEVTHEVVWQATTKMYDENNVARYWTTNTTFITRKYSPNFEINTGCKFQWNSVNFDSFPPLSQLFCWMMNNNNKISTCFQQHPRNVNLCKSWHKSFQPFITHTA